MGVHIVPVCAALDQNATQETYDESRETFREQEQAIRKMFAVYAKRTTFEGPLKLKMGAGEFFASRKTLSRRSDLISRPDIVKLALSCVDDPVDEPAFASGMSYEAFVGCLGKLAHALFATEALAPYCPNDKDRAELLMVRMHASAASTGYFERAWIENRKQHGNIATALGALRKLARKVARWRDGMQAMKASVNHPGSGPRIKTRHKLMFGEERRSPSSVRKQQKLVQRNIKRGIRRRDEDAELTFKPQINKNYRSRNPEKMAAPFYDRVMQAEERRRQRLLDMRKSKFEDEREARREAKVTASATFRATPKSKQLSAEEQRAVTERLYRSREVYLKENKEKIDKIKYTDSVTGQPLFKPLLNPETVRDGGKNFGRSAASARLQSPMRIPYERSASSSASEALYNDAKERRKKKAELREMSDAEFAVQRNGPKTCYASDLYVCRRLQREAIIKFADIAEFIGEVVGVVIPDRDSSSTISISDPTLPMPIPPKLEHVELPFMYLARLLRAVGLFFDDGGIDSQGHVLVELWSYLVSPQRSGLSLKPLLRFIHDVIVRHAPKKRETRLQLRTPRKESPAKPQDSPLSKSGYASESVSDAAYEALLQTFRQWRLAKKSFKLGDASDLTVRRLKYLKRSIENEEGNLTFSPSICALSRQLDEEKHPERAHLPRERILLHKAREKEKELQKKRAEKRWRRWRGARSSRRRFRRTHPRRSSCALKSWGDAISQSYGEEAA